MVAVRKNLDLVWVWFYKDVAPMALEIMSDSLSTFKDWCKDAFRFLLEKHDFKVIQEGRQYNQYYIVFGRGDVRLGVLGEGYGSIAAIHYLTRVGFEVPYQCVPADWQPALGKRKKKKTPQPSQQEQIFQAAKTIAERDDDILRGDMSRVNSAAQRLQALYERLRR
jgi:hypothetical protein